MYASEICIHQCNICTVDILAVLVLTSEHGYMKSAIQQTFSNSLQGTSRTFAVEHFMYTLLLQTGSKF